MLIMGEFSAVDVAFMLLDCMDLVWTNTVSFIFKSDILYPDFMHEGNSVLINTSCVHEVSFLLNK
jgi:hypothetical protein